MIGSLRELLPPNQLTQDVVQRALLVGWCIELVRSQATLHIFIFNKKNIIINIPNEALLGKGGSILRDRYADTHKLPIQ